jgi:hypothetical protein
LGRLLLEEGNHLFEMRNVSDWDVRVDVHCLSLGLRQNPECLELAVIETSVAAEICESNLFDVYAVKFGQSS